MDSGFENPNPSARRRTLESPFRLSESKRGQAKRYPQMRAFALMSDLAFDRSVISLS